MDVNSINNNISNLNQSSQLQIDKSHETKQVEKVDNEGASSLSINEYNKKRDELSLNVQSLNNGIAISSIATNSIEKQQSFLNNIQNELQNVKSEDNKLQDKNDIKQVINENLKNFNQVAYETKYKSENLLSLDNYDEKKSININTDNANFSIEKINTPDFANQIFETINGLDLNDPSQVDLAISKIESSTNQLQNISDKFTEFGNKVEESARETIKEQVDLYNDNKVNKDKNFGKESVDFSKNNISANLGYLAASQANIVQAQSVRLLS
jgi:flagellin